MSLKNCQACSELQNDAPNFIVNGMTNTEVNSLKNNTGLNPSNSNDDCTDLNNMNDCLIGNMEAEVDAYDVCDWKAFMKEYISNHWNVGKGIISAICGLWTNISNILSRISQLDCEVKYLYNGASFRIGEEETDGSFIVAGKGVSFEIPVGTDQHTSDITLQYIAGGLARLYGTCQFNTEDFTDRSPCYNFDVGRTMEKSADRKGNSVWGTTGRPANGGELVFEIRILKSQYPQVRNFFKGLGTQTNTGLFHVQSHVFDEGTWAYGQHGWCDEDTGEPMETGYSAGHRVQPGYRIIQVRMHEIIQMTPGNRYTPYILMGMRTNRGDIDC